MGWPYQQKPPMGWPLDYDSGLVPNVGFWPMLEGSGITVQDLSGNPNAGTITGALWTPGKFGSSLWFDHDDDVVDVAETGILNLSSAITLYAWIYITSTAAIDTVIGRFTAAEGGYEIYYSNQPRLRFIINSGGTDYDECYLAGAPATNTWIFVAGTFDGVTQKLYQNGLLVKSVAGSSMSTSASATFKIGSGLRGTMAGNIDHCGVYNRALSASEITLLSRYPFWMFKDPAEVALLGGYQAVVGAAGIMTTNPGIWGPVF